MRYVKFVEPYQWRYVYGRLDEHNSGCKLGSLQPTRNLQKKEGGFSWSFCNEKWQFYKKNFWDNIITTINA